MTTASSRVSASACLPPDGCRHRGCCSESQMSATQAIKCQELFSRPPPKLLLTKSLFGTSFATFSHDLLFRLPPLTTFFRLPNMICLAALLTTSVISCWTLLFITTFWTSSHGVQDLLSRLLSRPLVKIFSQDLLLRPPLRTSAHSFLGPSQDLVSRFFQKRNPPGPSLDFLQDILSLPPFATSLADLLS